MKISSVLREVFEFRTIELSLNNVCTLRCPGCSSLSHDNKKGRSLDYSSLLKFLKTLYSQRLVICGASGEPSLYQDFSDLLLELTLCDHHESIHISTNGEDIFSRLNTAEFSLEQKRKLLFQVAVDGHNQIIHTMTRKNGNLANVIDNINMLKKNGFFVEVVSTRHLLNENFSRNIYDFVKSETNEIVYFRDTTHVVGDIKPPSYLSKKGDVSILYLDKNSNIVQKSELTPKNDFLYINYDGKLFPCPSLVNHKLDFSVPEICKDDLPWNSLKKFYDLRKMMCECYLTNGDSRQCVVNCEIYRNFEYDSIEELEVL